MFLIVCHQASCSKAFINLLIIVIATSTGSKQELNINPDILIVVNIIYITFFTSLYFMIFDLRVDFSSIIHIVRVSLPSLPLQFIFSVIETLRLHATAKMWIFFFFFF